ncbi:DNA glycosylase AlkZ-like family protein [Actinoallomurus sp. CA-150999]|uniref:DNA glycosylase AlkZ-like family protein n=1 Tax=Actinoallomurus sp. CA-150999 TaxID=3239887 RepID=UPI003D94B2B2
MELLTVRCMRKTLHALPLPLAAAAHSATLRFRARDARRAAVNAGVSDEDLGRAVDRILTVLEAGPLQHRVLEQRLMSQGIPVPVGRIAIKTAWENGQIVYGNATTAWNREARTFALPATTFPGFVLDLDRGRALTTLIEAYFDRYGPATIRDATWWSGLSAADILTALSSCGREVVRVGTPWSDADALMFADRLEDFRTADPVTTGVNLLAHEDTALKAYHQTRTRYLGDLPQRRAFNQIGEALPTVMVDGRIAGTWQWDPARRAVVVSLARGRTTASQRRQVKNAADALTSTLRQGWVATRTSAIDADGRQLLLTGTSE